ncbi:hypothetical protein SpCBS45565_g06438 [Spizellomyces sp. 'palustris']|nr:hypothetical protein SpCBS45565_g06438 [Spizellomyces sp. 'palustris']
MSTGIAPLPIIDVTPFAQNASSNEDNAREKASTVEQLAAACVTYGAFYVKSGGLGNLTREFRKEVFSAAQDFFKLPQDTRNKIPIRSGGFTRGYIGLGGESGSSALEVKEAFSYGYPWSLDVAPTNNLQGPNEWPDTSNLDSTWQKTLENFYAGMVQVAEAVMRALSVALGMDEGYLPSFCAEGETISLMRLFHYFPDKTADHIIGQQSSSERIGSSPHTDWGFLTLIMQQDGVTGLQIADGHGGWTDVPPIPGTFLVNAGDYLSLLTNGRVVSPLHRVVSSDQERLSMVFFYYPRYDARIPLLTDDGPAARISLFIDQSQTKAQSKDNEKEKEQLAIRAEEVSKMAFGDYIFSKWGQVYQGNY